MYNFVFVFFMYLRIFHDSIRKSIQNDVGWWNAFLPENEVNLINWFYAAAAMKFMQNTIVDTV